MENWERTILMNTYLTDPERQRIAKGNLYDYQETALKRMRKLMWYLDDKYPGHTFELTGFEPVGLDTPCDFYRFTADGGKEKSHAIYSPKEALGFSDDYYAMLLEPAYDALLLEALCREAEARAIPKPVCCHTFFKAMYSREAFLPGMAEELLYDDRVLVRDSEIFLPTVSEEAVQAYEEIIEDTGICGAFRIYYSDLFGEGMDVDDCWGIWKTKRRHVRVSALVNTVCTAE